MIVSIVFRDGVENKYLRKWINAQSNTFKKYTQDITRVQVVISRVSHHKNTSSYIQCHISIHAAGKKHIDIYEKHSSEGIAFNRAYDRACAELSKKYSGKNFDRRRLNSLVSQTGVYAN